MDVIASLWARLNIGRTVVVRDTAKRERDLVIDEGVQCI